MFHINIFRSLFGIACIYDVFILSYVFIIGLFVNSLSVVASAEALWQSGEPSHETMFGL